MSEWPWCVVLICPASLRAKANLLACALGHDVLPGNTYSAPLSASGSAPATHYACATPAQQNFVDMLEGVAGGAPLPPIPWGDYGLTAADVLDVLTHLIFAKADLNERDGFFQRVLEANGLQIVANA